MKSTTLDLVAALNNDIEKFVKTIQSLQRRCKEIQTQIQAMQSGKEQVATKRKRQEISIQAEINKKRYPN